MPMIDKARLLRFVDGDEDSVVDMAQAFLASAPAEIVKARAAAQSGDMKQLAFSLHKLRSSVSIFHDGPATMRLGELEKQAIAGDASHITTALAELESELAVLVLEVRALISKP